MNYLFKLLLLIAVIFNHFSIPLGNQYCQETKVHDVVWHENGQSENYIASEPLCLDNLKLIVTRNCTDGGWMPPNEDIGCNSYQDEFKFAKYCPTGYVEIFNTGICILFLKHHVWSTDCIQRGSLTDVRQLIRTKPKIIEFLKALGDIDKFWLPARRDNNTEFIKWKLPPPLWNKPIEYDEDNIPIDNKGDCLAMNLVMGESLENCESKLPLICLFDRNTESVIMKSFCTGTSISTRFNRDTCFTVKPIDLDDIDLLTLVSTRDIYFAVQSVIQEFGVEKSPVVIDIIPGQNGYFNKIDYGNWIDDIDFSDWDPQLDRSLIDKSFDVQLYTVLWNEKWNLVDGNLLEYQIISEKYDLDDLPTITVNYNSSYDRLDVKIEHEIWLWKTNEVMLSCFSSWDAFEPVLKFDKIQRIDGQWKLSLPYFKGNAEYWCESVTLTDFSVVKSNVLQVQRHILNNELIYSVLIEVPCTRCQFYSELNEIESFIKHVNKVVRETDDFEVVNMQTKKIVEFNLDLSTVTVLFHCIVENIHSYSKSEALHIMRHLLIDILDSMSNNAKLIFIRDIDTCFSQNPYFPDTNIGQSSVYQIPCILEYSLPPIQHCVGDLINGAYWEHEYNETHLHCIETDTQPSIMEMLNKKLALLNSISITATLGQMAESIKHDFFDTPASVHSTTEMLQNIISSPQTEIFDTTPNTTFSEMPINTLADIIDTVINKNQSILQKAQSEMNTTNIMLETIDEIVRKYSTSRSFDTDVEKFSTDGTILLVKRSLIVLISNPLIKNITGIAIYKKTPYYADKNFDNYSIRKLFGNETYENIYNDTLDIGVNIPFKTLSQIKLTRYGEMVLVDRIIFKLFHKDSFFQEEQINGTTEILKANSKIIGITIPEYYDEHLPPGVFMILKKQTQKINNTAGYGCSDWTMNSTRFGWNKNYEHSEMLHNYGVLCLMTRLRNYGFVQLLGNELMIIESQEYGNDDRNFIFILSIVGCILSLFGMFVIFMTAALIKAWRKREATPLILNVCTATSLQLICYLLSETRISHHHLQCLIIGSSLHYVTIVGFFLSLFVSNLQYRRYIIIIGPSIPKHFKARLFIFGWIVPLLIVILCLYVNPNAYTRNKEFLDMGGICYPSGDVLLYAVHIPVLVIFCINLCIYIWVIINLTTERTNLRKSPTRSNISKQIFLFAYAFFLLSLTWIFGILAHFFNVNLFSYLFVITGTLQGFFIFVYCVIFDTSIRQVFKTIVEY